MSDTADRYRHLAADFATRVQAVPADRWSNPSPCEGWTARDVVDHVVGVVGRFFGMVGLDAPAVPSVDDDPVAAFAGARSAMQAALEDPAVADIEHEGRMGTMSLTGAVTRFGLPDLLVHTWDLSRAAGLDERLDPQEVSRAFEAMRPGIDRMRQSGNFAAPIEPAPGASEQTRLLNFTGRAV